MIILKNKFKKNHKNKNKNNNNINKEEINIKIKGVPRGVLRIITLGGVEEVGKNCTVLEYNDDIIIVDMGLQFPPEGFHGIQYIAPFEI